MLKVIETRRVSPSFEERITLDDNRSYRYESRILPVEDWQTNDGWGCSFISSIPLTLDTMKEARTRATHGR